MSNLLIVAAQAGARLTPIQESLSEVNSASLVMSEPALMKRPIFDDGKKLVLCGFNNEQQDILKSL